MANELVIHTGLKLDGSLASGSAEPLLARNAGTGIIQLQTGAAGNPFSDAETLIKNATDATKLAKFSAAGLTTGTTRTYTLPNLDGTLLLESTANTNYWKTSGTTDINVLDATILIAPTKNLAIQHDNASIHLGDDWDGPTFISGNGVALTSLGVSTSGGVGFESAIHIQSSFADFQGAKYGADYSANFVDRSLIDKGFANGAYWKVSGTTSIPLATTISLDDFDGAVNFKLAGEATAVLGVSAPDGVAYIGALTGSNIRLAVGASTGGNLIITDNRATKKGLEYAADYSASYIDRSLVDKGYVDSVTGGSVDTQTHQFEDFDLGITGYLSATAFNNGGGVGATVQISTFGQDGTENAIGVLDFGTGSSTAGGGAYQNTVYRHPIGFGTEHELSCRAALSALSDATDTYHVRLGYMDAYTTQASIGNALYFRYSHGVNAGKWQAVSEGAGIETAVDTGVLAVAGVFSVFKIVANSAGTSAAFYINGALVATITTNLPTAAGTVVGQAFTIEKTAGATSRSLYLDYFEKKTKRTAAR